MASNAPAPRPSTSIASRSSRPPSRKTSLEEKLELLEARFTMPHSSPSEATLGPLSSPGQATTSSQHSFSFDTPSLGGQHSNLSQSTVRPKQQNQTSLDAVSRAAAKHMAKVLSESASSNPTRLTAHLSRKNNIKVVRESPPALAAASSKARASISRTNTAADVSFNNNVSSPKQGTKLGKRPSSATKADKRKSIAPVKRELPSVKENWRNASSKSQDAPRKRLRETTATSTSTTTQQQQQQQQPLASSPLTHSRDNNNNNNNKSSKAASTRNKPPANNALIYDFFKSTTKKGLPTTTAAKPTNPASSSSTNVVSANNSSKTSSSLDQLQQRCQELERTCQDKDEQLKAIANNRTILHSALQSALTQREQELAAVKDEMQTEQQKRAAVMEQLVRSEAERQAKELREKLAVDGARLGRIVYTRAGLRSVETWEDGHASKHLREKRKELKQKRTYLEKRHAAAIEAAKQVRETKESGSREESGGADDGGREPVGGIHVRTPLEAMEATESVQFHLSNLSKVENELALEEQTLNDEKTAHIRALKRVASEDASRFRTRPKLHDRYVLRSLLGKGGFSEVWRAYDLIELCEVAVKIHQLDPRWSDAKKENYTKHVSREYEIHRNVRHPRIVSLYDVFEIDNNSFATVLECCNGTDLDTLLKEKRRLPERGARAILLQILVGMRYLSQPAADGSRQGIIHYDLKPGNILFDEFGDAKITDFGLSKIVDAADSAESMELTSQGAGTYWYLPPECFVLTDNVRISNKVDVWSIGVIFYQMLFGKRPFGDGQSQDKLLTDSIMLNAREVKFPEKPEVSEECKQFIRTCLTYDQTYRPSIAQLCENPYVQSKVF